MRPTLYPVVAIGSLSVRNVKKQLLVLLSGLLDTRGNGYLGVRLTLPQRLCMTLIFFVLVDISSSEVLLPCRRALNRLPESPHALILLTVPTPPHSLWNVQTQSLKSIPRCLTLARKLDRSQMVVYYSKEHACVLLWHLRHASLFCSFVSQWDRRRNYLRPQLLKVQVYCSVPYVNTLIATISWWSLFLSGKGRWLFRFQHRYLDFHLVVTMWRYASALPVYSRNSPVVWSSSREDRQSIHRSPEIIEWITVPSKAVLVPSCDWGERGDDISWGSKECVQSCYKALWYWDPDQQGFSGHTHLNPKDEEGSLSAWMAYCLWCKQESKGLPQFRTCRSLRIFTLPTGWTVVQERIGIPKHPHRWISSLRHIRPFAPFDSKIRAEVWSIDLCKFRHIRCQVAMGSLPQQLRFILLLQEETVNEWSRVKYV